MGRSSTTTGNYNVYIQPKVVVIGEMRSSPPPGKGPVATVATVATEPIRSTPLTGAVGRSGAGGFQPSPTADKRERVHAATGADRASAGDLLRGPTNAGRAAGGPRFRQNPRRVPGPTTPSSTPASQAAR